MVLSSRTRSMRPRGKQKEDLEPQHNDTQSIGAVSSPRAAAAASSSLPTALPPWERVLYKQQPYPDNYVPTSFLAHLRHKHLPCDVVESSFNPNPSQQQQASSHAAPHASSSPNRRESLASQLLLGAQQQHNDRSMHSTQHRITTRDYARIVASSLVILSRLSMTVLFVCCFCALYQQRLEARTLFLFDLSTIVVLYALHLFVASTAAAASVPTNRQAATLHSALTNTPSDASLNHAPASLDESTNSQSQFNRATNAGEQFVSHLARLVVLLLLLTFLTPLLATLTVSYSSDTIWTLTALLLGAHLLTLEYRSSRLQSGSSAVYVPMQALQGSTLAVNCAQFAALLLASRLEQLVPQSVATVSETHYTFVSLSDQASWFDSVQQQLLHFVPRDFVVLQHRHTSVASLLLTGHILFCGAHVVLQRVRLFRPHLHTACSLLLSAFALAALHQTQSNSDLLPPLALPLVFLACCCFVSLIAPAWLLHTRRYKQRIWGAWDYDDANEIEQENL